MTDVQRLCVGVEAHALSTDFLRGTRHCRYCGVSAVNVNPDEFPHKDGCLTRLARKVFAELKGGS